MPDTYVHFDLPADNPDRLKSFYASVFSWTFQTVPMPGDGTAQYHLAMTTEQGKPGINGGIFKKFAPDSKPVYFIGVANMDQSLSKVTGNGGRVLQPKMAIPGIGWFAVIADPEGNSQGVFQDDKAAK